MIFSKKVICKKLKPDAILPKYPDMQLCLREDVVIKKGTGVEIDFGIGMKVPCNHQIVITVLPEAIFHGLFAGDIDIAREDCIKIILGSMLKDVPLKRGKPIIRFQILRKNEFRFVDEQVDKDIKKKRRKIALAVFSGVSSLLACLSKVVEWW